MCAGIEPGCTATKKLYAQEAFVKIEAVEVRDLELTTSRRLERAGERDDLVVVEVEARHCVVRARLLGLLFEAEDVALFVELDDAVALGVFDVIAKHRRALAPLGHLLQRIREAVAVEEIVAEDERDRVFADEVGADEKRLGEALWAQLLGVGETHADVAAVAQQLAEARQIGGRGDDEDVADAGQHEHRERVVNHRLVVDRHELLADDKGKWMEASASASSKYNAFHEPIPLKKPIHIVSFT